mgnify:CR=1 FL=1
MNDDCRMIKAIRFFLRILRRADNEKEPVKTGSVPSASSIGLLSAL